jgi:predicted hotdog family 3-hydroxylacyl-ACP dehydratase
MLIGHEELCSLIPHAGTMCLLDGVEQWDQQHIVCLSNTHLDEANPLRSNGVLAAVHGVEYAAQAMAVHGGLLAREAGRDNPAGFLAALRDVQLNTERLDNEPTSLRIEANELMRSGGSFMYSFTVSAAGRELLAGRLIVMTQQEGT